MNDFEVKITTDANEIREAQRLRFQVFNLEMNKGLQASYARGLDCDDFDPICDHLIVRGPQEQRGRRYVPFTSRLAGRKEWRILFQSRIQFGKHQAARRRAPGAGTFLCTEGFSRQSTHFAHVECDR